MSAPPPTPRLEFRTWSADDLPDARSLWGDPEVTRFISRAGLADDAIVARLAFEIAHQEQHGFQYWKICEQSGGELVGCCGLHLRDPAARLIELGFHLRPAFWGQGLATEASRAAIAHAFEKTDAIALFAGHHPENHGSKRTLEKLGFRLTHQELYAPTGLTHPCYRLEPSR